MTTGYLYPARRLIEQFPAGTSACVIEEALKVGRKTVIRWRNHDCMLNERRADEYAIKIGKHPFEIWPEWFDDYKLNHL